MTSPSSQFNALLIDAPVGRHFAQLHRDEAALQSAVALFVETGLRREQAVLVYCAPATTAMIFAKLRESDIDPRREAASGRLRVHDAAAALSKLMRGGMPSWTEFSGAVTSELDAGAATATRGTRVYGEMVNLLWRDGRSAAAIRLEEYWNDIARTHPFSLFCGYTLDTHDPASYGTPLEDIARTHAHTEHADDDGFGVALDAACTELFGTSVAEMIAQSGVPTTENEAQLPPGLRSMVWLRRTQPQMSDALLTRTRALLVHRRSSDPNGQTARAS